MMNGWATQAFTPPAMVNEIYWIAGMWVKPSTKPDGGTAVTYVTIKEMPERKENRKKRIKQKKRS